MATDNVGVDVELKVQDVTKPDEGKIGKEEPRITFSLYETWFYPVIHFYGIWYKDKTAKRRIIHRCLVGGMLFVFAWGAITNDILQSPNEIFAVGEATVTLPYLVVYIWLIWYCHTRHIDKLMSKVVNYIGDTRPVVFLAKIHVIGLVIFNCASVIIWQTLLFITRGVTQIPARESAPLSVFAVLYLFLSPCLLLYFTFFSFEVQLYRLHVNALVTKLRHRTISLENARHDYFSLQRELDKICSTWSWMTGLILFFCAFCFIAWLYVAVITEHSLSWVYNSLLPAVLGFWIVGNGALATNYTGSVKDETIRIAGTIQNQRHHNYSEHHNTDSVELPGKGATTKVTYTYESRDVDSFLNYVVSCSPTFQIWKTPITPSTFSGILGVFVSVVALSAKIYSSGGSISNGLLN